MARKETKQVKAIRHRRARRKNIPTAEMESVVEQTVKTPIQVAYKRRNRDLDPQLVWRGKDEQDESDLTVTAPPLYIQEKVLPQAIVEELRSEAKAQGGAEKSPLLEMFAEFNGLPSPDAMTEFYRHDQNWSNRMIAGDSLQVMSSLEKREGLRGKVQCIYFDPPYGIKFNAKWAIGDKRAKEGPKEGLSREPEQIKAFRDTWRDGIHSYLTYLRDRLIVARELLHESGSIFVQIGDENVHRVRMLMDEVFGDENFCCVIQVQKTGSQASKLLSGTVDFILWYAKSKDEVKYRRLYLPRVAGRVSSDRYDQIELPDGTERRLSKEELARIADMPDGKIFQHTSLLAPGQTVRDQTFLFQGRKFAPKNSGNWKVTLPGMNTLSKSGRVYIGRSTIRYKRFLEDFSVLAINDRWESMQIGTALMYVVQTATRPIERCILMTTDPGDLVLDPTCGSGTTAYVAEQWGRCWITIDTSRVALAIARSRLMGARYPWYLLADSKEGQAKQAELTRGYPESGRTWCDIRQGFVYQRVPRITLTSIANNTEIDAIWEKCQPAVETSRAALNAALKGHKHPFPVTIGGRAGKNIDFTASGTVKLPSGEKAPAAGFMEWEVPRAAPAGWPKTAQFAHAEFQQARAARQEEIDASIAAQAEYENLYDKPYEDNSKLRVSGPFTVESLSPHRTLAVDENDELIDIDKITEGKDIRAAQHDLEARDFVKMILENLEKYGARQQYKEDRLEFSGVSPWPGKYICAEGYFQEGKAQKRAGIFIGPEFGTVARSDLVVAAQEAGEAGFDVLVACAYSYDALSADLGKIGRIRILRARMNHELHTGAEQAGGGNLFVIFGEPDIVTEDAGQDPSGAPLLRVRVRGVEVYKPQSGEVVSDEASDIAIWMLDTNYNGESFFVRHVYFLGTDDPYGALKRALNAEINKEAWESLHSDTSRPFPFPATGRIAVKAINQYGDEVMKIFAVTPGKQGGKHGL